MPLIAPRYQSYRPRSTKSTPTIAQEQKWTKHGGLFRQEREERNEARRLPKPTSMSFYKPPVNPNPANTSEKPRRCVQRPKMQPLPSHRMRRGAKSSQEQTNEKQPKHTKANQQNRSHRFSHSLSEGAEKVGASCFQTRLCRTAPAQK